MSTRAKMHSERYFLLGKGFHRVRPRKNVSPRQIIGKGTFTHVGHACSHYPCIAHCLSLRIHAECIGERHGQGTFSCFIDVDHYLHGESACPLHSPTMSKWLSRVQCIHPLCPRHFLVQNAFSTVKHAFSRVSPMSTNTCTGHCLAFPHASKWLSRVRCM